MKRLLLAAFGALLPVGAPAALLHHTDHAPQKYLDLYPGQTPELAAFFGMITNIDDNVGTTRALLRELGIADNTLFIFTTDNGTATGEKIFNAGMRGKKGSEYEGGHRVPLLAHWPAAGWTKPHVSDTLSHAVDIVPTLLDLTGAPTPAGLKFDGISLRPLLDPAAKSDAWPHERMLVTDSQRVRDPVKWKQTAVMSGPWRLVNNTELYDIRADPGQKQNLISTQPARAAKLRAFYDAWWAELEPTFAQTTEIYLGHPAHPVVNLTGHDWIQEALPPWNQQHIRSADGFAPARAAAGKTKNPKTAPPSVAATTKSVHTGHWAVKVVTAGRYEISVRRWPVEANHPITAALPPGANVPGADVAFRARPGIAIPATTATLRLDGRDVASAPVRATDTAITFTTTLTAGSHQLAPVFQTADGHEVGAYYAVVTKLP